MEKSCEYEILIEWIGAHCGEGRPAQKIVEATLSDIFDYVRENDSWPIIETMTMPNGDEIVSTKSGEGNIRRYTFMRF